MKEKYTSPVINTEELIKADILCVSGLTKFKNYKTDPQLRDNRTAGGQDLLGSIAEDFFGS
ncbi:MAG: hypothetical protein IIU14_05640 [Ruminococcus sp.]|nr:hypothetical protein [Ruminococcus sp.]